MGTNIDQAETPPNNDASQTSTPLILVEACFEPTDFDDHSIPIDDRNTLGEDINSFTTEILPSQQRHSSEMSKLSIHSESFSHDGILTTPTTSKKLSSMPHMFRLIRTWKPTYCSVCSSLVGYRVKGYECEECKLVCCSDCQLSVDVEYPCGSAKATQAVQEASSSKLSLQQILSVMAPIHEEKVIEDDTAHTVIPKESLTADTNIQPEFKDIIKGKRVGDIDRWNGHPYLFRIRVNKALMFQKSFRPEAKISDIVKKQNRWMRNGDYYVRISWTGSNDSKRTRTVFQTARPVFGSEEMLIHVPHFGTEFRIEVLNATTDKPAGTTLLTTQGLLQFERDLLAATQTYSLPPFAVDPKEPIVRKGVVLELRTGVKSGFGLDYFNATKSNDSSSDRRTSTQAGEISGLIDVDLCLEENPKLYSSNPITVPDRPPDDFNIDTIQLHISRIGAIVEDLMSFANTYVYMISWDNPALTSLTLMLSVTFCLRFNAEYIGSFPIFFLLLYMLYLWAARYTGKFQLRWTKKKKKDGVSKDTSNELNYSIHRSVGMVEVAVWRGKALISEHGIPGSLMASISWDPARLGNKKEKELVIASDHTAKITHHIGSTDNSGVTSSPVWNQILQSDESRRLKQLLPTTNFLYELSNEGDEINRDTNEQNEKYPKITFPVLQPIETTSKTLGKTSSPALVRTLPWKSSRGAIVIQLRFTDVLNKLPLFGDVLGDVVIPISELVQNGEVEGWYRVLEKGTQKSERIFCMMSDQDEDVQNSDSFGEFLAKMASPENEKEDDSKSKENEKKEIENPMIYLKAKLKLPEPNDNVSDEDKETSIVIAEEMVRSVHMSQDNRLGIISSSLSTLNSFRGVGGNLLGLQNQLGAVLDIIEMIRNLINFSCPEKSICIFICLAVLLFLLALIPTRYVILGGIIGQYAATFMSAYSSKQDKISNEVCDEDLLAQNEDEPDSNAIFTWLMNFLKSIPTDEDLRRFYFWEACQVSEQEREVHERKKRNDRLNKLWKAQWFGDVEMKVKCKSSEISMTYDWEGIFAIIIGHRFIWWESEKCFDDGDQPLGMIFFAGHSGLAGLSPLELRELSRDEIKKVVNIFGRGSKGQMKISLLTTDAIAKDRLENAVIRACCDVKID